MVTFEISRIQYSFICYHNIYGIINIVTIIIYGNKIHVAINIMVTWKWIFNIWNCESYHVSYGNICYLLPYHVMVTQLLDFSSGKLP